MDVQVTFDRRTSEALGFVRRTTDHGVPERVALVRASRKYGTDKNYLRALLRLSRQGE